MHIFMKTDNVENVSIKTSKMKAHDAGYQCRLAGDEDICRAPAVVPLGRLSQSLERSTLHLHLYTAGLSIFATVQILYSFGINCARPVICHF